MICNFVPKTLSALLPVEKFDEELRPLLNAVGMNISTISRQINKLKEGMAECGKAVTEEFKRDEAIIKSWVRGIKFSGLSIHSGHDVGPFLTPDMDKSLRDKFLDAAYNVGAFILARQLILCYRRNISRERSVSLYDFCMHDFSNAKNVLSMKPASQVLFYNKEKPLDTILFQLKLKICSDKGKCFAVEAASKLCEVFEGFREKVEEELTTRSLSKGFEEKLWTAFKKAFETNFPIDHDNYPYVPSMMANLLLSRIIFCKQVWDDRAEQSLSTLEIPQPKA